MQYNSNFNNSNNGKDTFPEYTMQNYITECCCWEGVEIGDFSHFQEMKDNGMNTNITQCI